MINVIAMAVNILTERGIEADIESVHNCVQLYFHINLDWVMLGIVMQQHF